MTEKPLGKISKKLNLAGLLGFQCVDPWDLVFGKYGATYLTAE